MSKLTVVLIIVVLVIVLFIAGSQIARFSFNRSVEREVEELFGDAEGGGVNITEEDIEKLPQSVQKWLRYSKVIGREKTTSVRLKQRADMRMEKDKPWMPVKAEQYFT